MSIVILQLPKVKRSIRSRPRHCPYCQGETFQRWGKGQKRVRDPHLRSVTLYRYCCCHCRRTFRHYPQGVDRAAQTQRLRKAAVAWALGLSYRRLVALFAAFGVSLSRMSAWRDVQAWAESLCAAAPCGASKPAPACCTACSQPLPPPAEIRNLDGVNCARTNFPISPTTFGTITT